MNGSFLLDTNIVIAILNRDATLEQRIRGRMLYIPSIVLGELYYGARNSAQVAANLTRIQTFKTRCTILPCDENTADQYGQIRQQLATKGRPIPDNDIWIAAIARQRGLPLVSRDEHFKEIDGLSVETW